MQRPRDSGHQILFFRQPLQRFLDDPTTLRAVPAGAGPADDETESALLAMDPERVVDFLLVMKQFDVAECEGIIGQTEIELYCLIKGLEFRGS